MQDNGKILARVYELILGQEIMNVLAGIFQRDKAIAVQIMSVAVRAELGDMPADEAKEKIDLLVVDYKQSQGIMDDEK